MTQLKCAQHLILPEGLMFHVHTHMNSYRLKMNVYQHEGGFIKIKVYFTGLNRFALLLRIEISG